MSNTFSVIDVGPGQARATVAGVRAQEPAWSVNLRLFGRSMDGTVFAFIEWGIELEDGTSGYPLMCFKDGAVSTRQVSCSKVYEMQAQVGTNTVSHLAWSECPDAVREAVLSQVSSLFLAHARQSDVGSLSVVLEHLQAAREAAQRLCSTHNALLADVVLEDLLPKIASATDRATRVKNALLSDD